MATGAAERVGGRMTTYEQDELSRPLRRVQMDRRDESPIVFYVRVWGASEVYDEAVRRGWGTDKSLVRLSSRIV